MKNFTNPKKDNATIDTVEALLPPSIGQAPEIAAIQQVITAKTRLYVVTDEGISDMTLRDVANAFRGGMDADTIAICTTESFAESELKHRQRKQYADLVLAPGHPRNTVNRSDSAMA
jgi:hypothetical protein